MCARPQIPSPPGDRQRAQLQRWLAEWRLDGLLGGEPPGHEPAAPDDAFRRANGPAGPPPEPTTLAAGDIRLLFPDVPATAARPRYVAILEPPRAGRQLAAPFGRFAEPGLPGEWATGRTEPPLRVLCLWNARALPRAVVAKSWLVGRMTPRETADARSVRRSLRANRPPSPRLAAATGPPLLHPADPRWEYRDQELEWMRELEGEASGTEEGMEKYALPAAGEEADDAPQRLAAEPQAAYGRAAVFAVPGRGLFLHILPSAAAGGLQIDVRDAAGLPSRALDGCALAGARGQRSAPFADAQVLVPSAFVRGGFALLCADGKPITIEAV